MEFIATKVLLWLILPPASLLIMLLTGFLLVRKHPVLGRAAVAGAVILLYLLSLPLAADMLMRPLETTDHPFDGNQNHAAAIVVLGGGVLDRSGVPAPPELTQASLARVVAGVELARRFRLPMVVSGGSGAIDGSTVKEADAMANQALRLGLAARNLLIENRSRNTRENARYVRSLLSEDRIILVTSAFHMKRAAGMFKKQGFTVTPAPVGYRSQTITASWTNLLPRSEHLDTSSRAIAEYLSLVWYRLNNAL